MGEISRRVNFGFRFAKQTEVYHIVKTGTRSGKTVPMVSIELNLLDKSADIVSLI
jgi:hypothetical protein